MRHFTKIMSGIDVAPLLAQLELHPELWDEISYRRTGYGTPHGEMTDIWVRYRDIRPFIERGDFSGFNDEHVPMWYPAWKKLPALHSIVFDLMAAVDGEMIGAVLITKIPPGGKITRHVDAGWHVENFSKFYLALKNDTGSEFVCDHGGCVESLNSKPGEIWLFDNRKPHWVINDSDRNRITLIICIRTELFQ